MGYDLILCKKNNDGKIEIEPDEIKEYVFDGRLSKQYEFTKILKRRCKVESIGDGIYEDYYYRPIINASNYSEILSDIEKLNCNYESFVKVVNLLKNNSTVWLYDGI